MRMIILDNYFSEQITVECEALENFCEVVFAAFGWLQNPNSDKKIQREVLKLTSSNYDRYKPFRVWVNLKKFHFIFYLIIL